MSVGDRSWSVPFPVRDVRRIGGRILVIYDHRHGPPDQSFANLEAFDDDGRKLWTAENPGTGPANAYVEFMSERPLVARNFACFRCTIDPSTGKLLEAVFTK